MININELYNNIDKFIESELERSLKGFYPKNWKIQTDFDRYRVLEFICDKYHIELEQYLQANQFLSKLDEIYLEK